MTNLLAMARQACGLAGISPPASVANTNDPQALGLMAIAKESLKHLCLRNWPVLKRQYSFQTANGQSAYALPSDFCRLISDTAWDSSLYYRMRGQVSDSEWQRIAVQGNALGGKRYRVIYSGTGLQFVIQPTPTTVETMIFEYVTSNWALDVNNVPIPTFTSDTDSPLVSSDLLETEMVWRYKKQKGLDYGEEFKEARYNEDTLYAQAINSGEFYLAAKDTVYDNNPLTVGFVPEQGYGA